MPQNYEKMPCKPTFFKLSTICINFFCNFAPVIRGAPRIETLRIYPKI